MNPQKKKSLNKVAAKVNNIKDKEGGESGADSGNALNQIIHRAVCEKKETFFKLNRNFRFQNVAYMG